MGNYYLVMACASGDFIVGVIEADNMRKAWEAMGYRPEAFPMASWATHTIYMLPENEILADMVREFEAHA